MFTLNHCTATGIHSQPYSIRNLGSYSIRLCFTDPLKGSMGPIDNWFGKPVLIDYFRHLEQIRNQPYLHHHHHHYNNNNNYLNSCFAKSKSFTEFLSHESIRIVSLVKQIFKLIQ